jgi:hypothetical protein
MKRKSMSLVALVLLQFIGESFDFNAKKSFPD